MTYNLSGNCYWNQELFTVKCSAGTLIQYWWQYCRQFAINSDISWSHSNRHNSWRLTFHDFIETAIIHKVWHSMVSVKQQCSWTLTSDGFIKTTVTHKVYHFMVSLKQLQSLTFHGFCETFHIVWLNETACLYGLIHTIRFQGSTYQFRLQIFFWWNSGHIECVSVGPFRTTYECWPFSAILKHYSF